MNYEETLEYLYTRLPMFQRTGASAYKEGLENSLALDNYLGNPHKKYKTIHVGGTNGKGSTSHLLAAVLQQSGYKVGLYTSPHLVDFRERIRVNGEMIEKDFIIDFVERHRAFSETIHPSFFELTMTMAFDYFAQRNVEVAIIEVGLGGRLDSTNIITPDISVITNISFDHVQFLGDSLPKIATEKAGIIKPGIPVVIGEAIEETETVFRDKANEVSAPIYFAEQEKPIVKAEPQSSGGWLYIARSFGEVWGELGGLCQDKNAATVFLTLEILIKQGYDIPQNAIKEGFAKVTSLTGLQGRWQKLGDAPKIICDTAHNEGGIQYIVQQLANERYDTLHFVIGMVNDKDVNKVLSMLPRNARYYFTKAGIPRALDATELQQKALEYQLAGASFLSVPDAVNAAKANASENDLIYIGGSTFVVADALPVFFFSECK
jgi:folylpolyglutamate synthase/dihydrofolate synthase